jgi:glycosyltransferase involved in cell wall biosynthesis
MPAKRKILFCHNGFATFVKTDFEILSEKFVVIPYHYKVGRNKLMKAWNIFLSFFFALRWVWKVDVVYVWFGGYHGFFPVLFSKLLGKKSIIIVGGYDASYVPSLRYGVFYTKGLLLWVIKRIYQWATHICPVDESLVKSTNYYADPTGVGYPTGILNHMDVDTAKIKVIPTGYDPSFFKPNFGEKIFDIVASGYVEDENNFQRKGFDLILQVAPRIPHLNFAIIGISNSFRKKIETTLPPNIHIQEFVSQNQLIDYFSKSKVYVQISIAEGLPNTLCEAMLCQCVPVGSPVNGIPKAIGDTGFILQNKNIDNLQAILLSALQNSKQMGIEARKRMMDLFPLSKRRALLLDILKHP